MSDSISESRLVEWIRELFVDATPESMIRWMLVAWLVSTAVLVGLDRLSSVLVGRSRPIAQQPPKLARSWRWRKGSLPPATYSMLPSGTMVPPTPSARSASIPLAYVVDDEVVEAEEPTMLLERPEVDDNEYWRDLVSVTTPLFGYENNSRLELGRPPERFNPVLGRVEQITRVAEQGRVSWPESASDAIAISFDPDEVSGDSPTTE